MIGKSDIKLVEKDFEDMLNTYSPEMLDLFHFLLTTYFIDQDMEDDDDLPPWDAL